MKRCFIFAAGTFYGLREKPAGEDFVIAADAGYQACVAAGVVPDLLLGDFDSMEAPENFEHILRLPVEKDDTDTMAAVKYGLEQGCTEFHIYGGTGGKRLDHTLANLQTLLYLRRQGARGWLYDDVFLWTVIENESLTIPKTVEWGLMSVFCMGDRAEGVCESGVQYPWSVQVSGTLYGPMWYNTEENLVATAEPNRDWIHRKSPFWIWNVRGEVEIAKGVKLFALVNNLFNKV